MASSLATVVDAWRDVVATDSRSAKIARLAQCLRTVDSSEIELVVHYLAGELPQGKLGVGRAGRLGISTGHDSTSTNFFVRCLLIF